MHGKRRRWSLKATNARHIGGVALLAATAVTMGASCSGSGGDSSQCQATRAYFEQNVWSKFMAQKCGKCHLPDGTAVIDKNAKFQLQPSSYPGFVDANLANIAEVIKIDYEGKPEILQKPLGKANHGGGVKLMVGDDDYNALAELVDRVKGLDSCTEAPNTTLQNVTLADGPSTFRRAALDLAGRLPTDAEKTAVSKGGDAALDKALDGLMQEDTFIQRVKEIFNDLLLTDRFLSYDGAAIDFMNDDDYPAMKPYHDSNSPQYNSDDRALINRALAQEPLDLIAYVVKNNKPFTDVVESTYTVVNPYSAIAYGLDSSIQFKDKTDYTEFHEAQVNILVNGMTSTPIPHAGVLSTPSFLNRWQTTPTNRNRGRARRVFSFFLAWDVLKIAERPVDATKVTGAEDPTRNSDLCITCHRVIDPIAGCFRGYDDNDYEDFDPSRMWHDEMFPPGYGEDVMPPTFYGKAQQYLGPKVAADPRFAISAVRTVYKGLTGKDPIAYPSDNTDPAFATKIAAWSAQDSFFRDTATAFTKAGSNLKTIFKAVIKSPYYRAVSAPADMDPGLLQDVGVARILTPEMLNRKIAAITNYRWRKDYNYNEQHDWLMEDYKILYGGIDSESTITRLTAPNGIIAAVATRMANEASCSLTAYDFTKGKAVRTFFPKVDVTEVPESSGHPVDGSVADIKANIQYLHELFLDEKLDVNDPEITRTFQLFLDTWHELNNAGDGGLPYGCSGRWNPVDGTDLPDASQITDDKNYTIRSWQAVMAYLMSDYKFLYE